MHQDGSSKINTTIDGSNTAGVFFFFCKTSFLQLVVKDLQLSFGGKQDTAIKDLQLSFDCYQSRY